MAKKGQTTTRFSIQSYDAAHYRQTEQYTQAVEALFDRANAEISKAAIKGTYDPDKPFSFDDYPSVRAVMQDVTRQLANRMTAVIGTGAKKEWLFACKKNDGFISSIMDTSRLSKERLCKMQDQNLDALKAFQGRKVEGMNLAERVWKYVGQYREQIETALDVGLGDGRSAVQLSQDVRENLKEPTRLFRRVRDKRGNLHLSKAAKAFHPGQGVYRSSYKNAMRLTRSEINMAYRESDFLRWQSLDFVVGFEIHRSNHKPLCKCDLCEKLVGRYPKTFKFKGWHPQCMCYATPILMDEETFDENELGDLKAALHGTQYKQLEAKNLVTDVPQGFKDWVKDHIDAQKNWGSTPYFIKDNFIEGDLSLGLKGDSNDGGVKTIMQAIEQVKAWGITHVDFGDCTIEQANVILEALQEEFDYFGDAGIPLDSFTLAKKYKGSNKEGGHYSPSDNGITINLSIFDDEADSGKSILEKIASLEAQKAKLEADIDKWTAKLGINAAADKMLKSDIKMMKSKVTDIEIKITGFKKDIAAGHNEISLTYADSLKDVKARVKALVHHEFGHLFDYKYNGGQGYAGDAYNSIYAKTTDKESLAEWFAQWMSGDKEGIPQELLDAFEGKTMVDTSKAQLAAIMPQIIQARQQATKWGLSVQLRMLELRVSNKDVTGLQTTVGIIESKVAEVEQRNASVRAKCLEWGIATTILDEAMQTPEIINILRKMSDLEDMCKEAEREYNTFIFDANNAIKEAQKFKIDVSGMLNDIATITGGKREWVMGKASYKKALQELKDQINKAISESGGGDTPHKAIRTSYTKDSELDDTFKVINSEFKMERWFEHGDLQISPTKKRSVNGFTHMDGRISLTPERLEFVKSAMAKIGQGKSVDITFEEADAMVTMWHEITHNRNVPGSMIISPTQTDTMEMMNEFVARKTLPEFYKKLGCANIPHPEFINNRASTGYNHRVLGYDFVIQKLGLAPEKVLESAKKNLFALEYTEQETTAIQALLDGGLDKFKRVDGKPISKAQMKKIVVYCRKGVSTTTLENYMKDEGIIPK